MTDSATCSRVGLTTPFSSSSEAPKGASGWVMDGDGLGGLLAREQGAA